MVTSSRILVFGDSYANFHRFEAGITDAFAQAGRPMEVSSISLPGADSAKLAGRLSDPALTAQLNADGPYAAILLIAGINDITKRRGVAAFSKSMRALVNVARPLSMYVFALEIIDFDERVDISATPFRLRNAARGLIFDRAPGRVATYRKAVQGISNVVILPTSDFLPAHDAARFKDGVHLTDVEFDKLARHTGEQMLQAMAGQSP